MRRRLLLAGAALSVAPAASAAELAAPNMNVVSPTLVTAGQAVARLWSSPAAWKRFIAGTLRSHGVSFEPY
jgi:uncharacterized protein (DUF2141 family)